MPHHYPAGHFFVLSWISLISISSHHNLLPAPLHKHQCAYNANQYFSRNNGYEYALWAKVPIAGKQVSKWYLKKPKARNIYNGWRFGISRAIKGIHHYHTKAIKNIAEAYYV